MEFGNNGLLSCVGKRVKIIYDGEKDDVPKTRVGLLLNVADGFLFLKQDAPYPKLALSQGKIIRIEVID